MAIREGLWDCPSCGRKGNRGPQRSCVGCGAPRGDDVAFYLAHDAPEVTDPKALAAAEAGADWTCEFCGGDNRATDEVCRGCSAARGTSPQRPERVILDADAAPPPPPQGVAAPPEETKKKKKRRGCGCLTLLGLVVLFFAWLGCPNEQVVTVTGLSWERTVEVEQHRVESGEAWSDELPKGAEELSRQTLVDGTERVQVGTRPGTRTVTERVQVGTEQVKVGVRDLGNGYFEDVYEDRPVYETRSREEPTQEPIYETRPRRRDKVRYRLETWQPARTERAAGNDRNPAWPQLRLRSDERAGKREESYVVHFRDADGDAYVYRPKSEAEWSGFRLGERYEADLGSAGNVRRILGRAHAEAP